MVHRAFAARKTGRKRPKTAHPKNGTFFTLKGKQIGQPQVTADDISGAFLRHYPAYKSGKLNISELAKVCDLSRTTVY